ncbi:MAG: hypothetical protein IJX65_05565 [Alistipes sp.]|nr:hypothetical protein [Alistipes sp.]
MRTKIAILLLFATLSLSATAQRVATGERLPRIKVVRELLQESQLLYIGFVHSASEPCRQSTAQIRALLAGRADISSLYLTREADDWCEMWLLQMATEGENVETEASAIFQKLDVDYAPFGVIIDHKRRVVWFGNPRVLNSNNLEQILR